MLDLQLITKAYHNRAPSIAEYVPWFQALTDELVICHDGALLAAFEFEGLDFDSTDEADLDSASAIFEIAAQAFDSRNIVWTFLDKRRCVYIDDTDIGHPIARYVEQRWLNYVDSGNLARFRHVIYVSYQPFSGSGSLYESINAFTKQGMDFGPAVLRVLRERFMLKGGIERVEGKIESAIIAFENQLEAFSQGLGRLGIRRLSGNPLITDLSNRINLATQRERVSFPPTGPLYLNTFLPVDHVSVGDAGVLSFTGAEGRNLVSMLSIKGYPRSLRNTHAEHLLMLPGDFSVVQSFRFLDREAAHSMIMRKEAALRSSVKGPLTQLVEKATGHESERIDTGKLVLADDARQALAELTADGVNFGYHTMAVQVIGRDLTDVEATQRAVASVLKNAGFGVVPETGHSLGAFVSCIPGAADKSVRATLISTRNLADLAVLRSVQPGHKENRYFNEQRGVRSRSLCLFPTPSGVPEHFNFHVGDIGHFMVVGGTGAGKTSLMNLLFAHWMRYAPCRIIVLDKDNSCYLTIKALGGSYVRLADGDGHVSTMNPLRWLDHSGRWSDIGRWIMGAMSAFPGSAGLNEREAQAIYTTISNLAAAGADAKRTLGTFKDLLEGTNADLAARLAPWVRPTHSNSAANYGPIFDNEEDAFAEQLQAGANGIIGIDMGGLLKDEKLAPSVLEYLFMAIDDLVEGKVPTLIYLEEGWYLLGNKRFREGFEDWLKTMRKRMAAVGVTTQSVQDIARSDISSTLNDNIRTRIFLPNPQAFASREIYTDMLGLSNDDVNLIRQLTPKRHYLAWQDGRKRVLDAWMPPEVLALTRSDRLARDLFDRYFDPNEESSVIRYIKEITNAA